MSYHSCSFFCQDGVHAIRVLARPGVSAEDLRTFYVDRLGHVVIRIIQAREANVATWQADMPRGWKMSRAQKVTLTQQDTDACTVPWLVFITTYGKRGKSCT